MEFLSSGLWWTFFILTGLFLFIYQFGRQGHGTMSPIIMVIGGAASLVILILAFVFFWWQGGLGIAVSWIVWSILTGIVFGLIGRRTKCNS